MQSIDIFFAMYFEGSDAECKEFSLEQAKELPDGIMQLKGNKVPKGLVSWSIYLIIIMPTRIIKVTSPKRPRILEVMKRSTLVLRMNPNILILENVVLRQKRKGSLAS